MRMIPERLMVRGIGINTGEVVTGILCTPSYPGYAAMEPWYVSIRVPEEENKYNYWYFEPVDIETVEPVAVPPEKPYNNDVLICPNCKGALGGHQHKYCSNCGQRILWEN